MANGSDLIGVFDSGVGGLTVLRAIVDQLPGESTVYLGDTARVPYGTKSAAVVTKYALRVVDHLLRFPLKALVVACNTASAVALPALRDHLDIPVLGVVEPGARRAVEVGRTGRIGVIATEGTIRSRAYERALLALEPQAQVVGKPCPLFVPLVEEGMVTGPIVEQICHHYLDELRGQIDTAILGCTHYPLLATEIARTLGPEIEIVDSAAATAAALGVLLQEHDLLAAAEGTEGQHRFLFTDAPERTAELSARFFQKPVARIEAVDL